MGMFESNNPMLNEKSYAESSAKASAQDRVLDADQVIERRQSTVANPMTVMGAVNKTIALTGIMLMTAVVGFMFPSKLFLWGGMLGGAAIFWITSKNLEKSMYLAPAYAAVEGLFVGTVSAMYASMMNGIIFQAVTLTLGIMFAMLMLYKSGLIKVTEKFRAGVMMAVGGVMIYYAINIVLHLLGITIPLIHDGGALSIGICLVIIVIASMNLLLDFDNFHKGEQHRAPKYMEWYSGMGLLFTLIWLYVEILRLLSYLNRE